VKDGREGEGRTGRREEEVEKGRRKGRKRGKTKGKRCGE
jgi:hypothetical protein